MHGYGADRLKKFEAAFNAELLEWAKLCVEDGKTDKMIDYTKGALDRKLKAIMGDEYPEWERRYPIV